jgi:hypothetical protein
MPVDTIKKYLIKKGVSKEKLDSMTEKEMDGWPLEEISRRGRRCCFRRRP